MFYRNLILVVSEKSLFKSFLQNYEIKLHLRKTEVFMSGSKLYHDFFKDNYKH